MGVILTGAVLQGREEPALSEPKGSRAFASRLRGRNFLLILRARAL